MSETQTFTSLPLWEQTQYKAFRNWVNINLSSLKVSIQALEADFKNGSRLVQLTEILQKKSIGKWNKEPKRQMQELENLNIAITAIQKDNVKLVNIGSTDINEGNLKIILGLIWTLIQHYHINQLDFLEVGDSGANNTNTSNNTQSNQKQAPKKNVGAKEKLLGIVNEIIKPWGYEAKNFTTDFEDGRILQCLAHTREPKTIRDPTQFGKDKHANVKEALQSFDSLNVPRVMDVEDISDRHDEKAMMTLLGYVLKELGGRKQVAFAPGTKTESQPQQTKQEPPKEQPKQQQKEQPKQQPKQQPQEEEEEELIEGPTRVQSRRIEVPSSTTSSNTQSQDLGDLPKVKRDNHNLFSRFVEIGRVVLITYGEYEGKIAAILDVIDANSVVVAGPTSGVPRHPISLKRVQLTDIVVPFRRNPRPNTLAKAWNEARVQQVWENTAWGKKLESRKRKAEMSDFDRFKAMVAHQQRAKLIRNKRRELAPNKKSKK